MNQTVTILELLRTATPAPDTTIEELINAILVEMAIENIDAINFHE